MKKLLALALILSSIAVLAGCGESVDQGTNGTVVNTDTGAGKATANSETGDRN